MSGGSYGPYKARVVDVHDGDTIALDIDLGFDHFICGLDFDLNTRLSCRVLGINAPELSTAAGKTALAFAKTLLHVGDRVTVTSRGWDKYGGRFDGIITLPDGRDFAKAMLDGGQAKPYNGGAR